jgi:hypothetical protein
MRRAGFDGRCATDGKRPREHFVAESPCVDGLREHGLLGRHAVVQGEPVALADLAQRAGRWRLAQGKRGGIVGVAVGPSDEAPLELKGHRLPLCDAWGLARHGGEKAVDGRRQRGRNAGVVGLGCCYRRCSGRRGRRPSRVGGRGVALRRGNRRVFGGRGNCLRIERGGRRRRTRRTRFGRARRR